MQGLDKLSECAHHPALIHSIVSYSYIRGLLAQRSAGIVQQRQVAGALDRPGKGALVASACASLAARADFPLFGNKAAQHFNLLVVNDYIVIGAEQADAWLRIETPTSALFLSFIRYIRFFHF